MTSAGGMTHRDDDPASRAAALISLFCPTDEDFGRLAGVEADAVPELPRRLLDHRSHMTVTMERHHGCPLDLRVVEERLIDDAAAPRYAREILLLRPDGTVVQHGIVRIDLAAVDPPTAKAIREGRQPLGRILVAAGLLCDVQHVRLVRLEIGPHLRRLFGGTAKATYGRVAEILVGGLPAIELLEILAPAAGDS